MQNVFWVNLSILTFFVQSPNWRQLGAHGVWLCVSGLLAKKKRTNVRLLLKDDTTHRSLIPPKGFSSSLPSPLLSPDSLQSITVTLVTKTIRGQGCTLAEESRSLFFLASLSFLSTCRLPGLQLWFDGGGIYKTKICKIIKIIW